MNNVSWFLYLVQIISNIGVITVIVLIVLGLSFIILLVFGAIEQDLHYSKLSENPIWPIVRNIGIVLAIFTTIGVFIPSKETMYMIAASQVGEQVIQLQQVQEVGGEVGGLAKDTIELLRQQIQEQLTEKPVEAPKPD